MSEKDTNRYSAEYTKYLRKRYELEKRILRERSEYDPENPGRIQELLKGRNEELSGLGQMHAELSEIGIGHITSLPISPMPWEIAKPYGVPREGYIDIAICGLNQTLNIEDATYVVLDSDRQFAESAITPKTAYSQTSANPYWSDDSGLIRNGYRTTFSVPAADGVTSVTITSALRARFSWVEANAIESGSESFVSASGHLELNGPSGVEFASPVTLVSFAAENGEVLSHNDMSATTLDAIFELRTSVPPGSGAAIQVFETAMLKAITPNGHAYISGTFSWQPLSVTITEGCRPIRIPRWWY